MLDMPVPNALRRSATKLSHVHILGERQSSTFSDHTRLTPEHSTMALMAWTNDPLLYGLEKAMDKAFDRAIGSRELGAFLPTFTGHNGAGAHPMDIVETKDSFQLHADAPGFVPEDISVEMNQGVLTITGKRKEEKIDEKDGRVVRRERHLATFTRSFTLPENVTDEGISASLDKGVLKVTVPKIEPAPKPQPKIIQVTAASS